MEMGHPGCPNSPLGVVRKGTTFPSILKKSGRHLAYLRPAIYCFTRKYELTVASKKRSTIGKITLAVDSLCFGSIDITSLLNDYI